jgi:hypothetical protein
MSQQRVQKQGQVNKQIVTSIDEIIRRKHRVNVRFTRLDRASSPLYAVAFPRVAATKDIPEQRRAFCTMVGRSSGGWHLKMEQLRSACGEGHDDRLWFDHRQQLQCSRADPPVLAAEVILCVEVFLDLALLQVVQRERKLVRSFAQGVKMPN